MLSFNLIRSRLSIISLKRRNVFLFFAILVLIATLPALVLVANKTESQNSRSFASESNSDLVKKQNLDILQFAGKNSTTPSAVTSSLIRKQEMIDLAKSNPQSFLDNSLANNRDSLPDLIKNNIERNYTNEGELKVLVIEDERNPSYAYLFLPKNETASYYLYFTTTPQGLTSGSSITIKGVALGNEIVLDNSHDTASFIISRKPLKPLIKLNLAIFLIQYANQNQKFTSSSVQNRIFTNKLSTVNYYKDATNSRILVKGKIFGWHTTSVSESDICNNSNQIFDEIRQEAANGQIDLSGYNVTVVIPPGTNGVSPCSFAGYAEFGNTVDGVALVFQTNIAHTLAHELGHTLGLEHASLRTCGTQQVSDYANCTSYEYGDEFDIMGQSILHAEFNAPHLEQLGLIQAKEITTSGTYTIYATELHENKTSAIKIKKPDTNEYYYLEFRRLIDFDNYEQNFMPGQVAGTFIRTWDGQGFTYLLDMSPSKNTFPQDNYVLKNGETFIDAKNGIKIKQLSFDNEKASVKITFTTPN